MKIEIQIWKRHKATSPTFQISKRATIDGISVRTTQQKKSGFENTINLSPAEKNGFEIQ